VLFALEGQVLSGGEAKEAAEILARAGRRSLGKDDPLMALQLAQMAFRYNPDEALAHEVAARGYKLQEQFSSAEEHAERWITTSGNDKSARLFRAQLALEQGDWQRSVDLAESLKGGPLSPEERALTELIRAQGAKELKDRRAGLSTARSLEQRMESAVEKAKKGEARTVSARGGGSEAVAASGSNDVVVYTTAWCGYCKQAKAFLQQRRVPFIERDVEKDESAAQELAAKAVRAKVRVQGVPVIDVRGQLVLGFNRAELERWLR
jgi:glutaredoxin